MMSAFVLSSIFLISYVISKLTNAPTPFGGEGSIRYVYFFVLISHIILSIPVLPLALFSIYRGLTGEISKHKKCNLYIQKDKPIPDHVISKDHPFGSVFLTKNSISKMLPLLRNQKYLEKVEIYENQEITIDH